MLRARHAAETDPEIVGAYDNRIQSSKDTVEDILTRMGIPKDKTLNSDKIEMISMEYFERFGGSC